MLPNIVNHLRNRDYMSGVERDKSRIKATGEVFTPTLQAQEILNTLPDNLFTNTQKSFIDPSCGDGQFLAEIIIKKVEQGSTYHQALSTTYGVDLMPDNCLECIRRLYMCSDSEIREFGHDTVVEQDPNYYWSPGLRAIYWVDTPHYCGWAKIVCADGLKYDYGFGEAPELKTSALLKVSATHKKKQKKKHKEHPNLDLFVFG
jgi:hypothetical protein